MNYETGVGRRSGGVCVYCELASTASPTGRPLPAVAGRQKKAVWAWVELHITSHLMLYVHAYALHAARHTSQPEPEQRGLGATTLGVLAADAGVRVAKLKAAARRAAE
jgi:hypothetical protein